MIAYVFVMSNLFPIVNHIMYVKNLKVKELLGRSFIIHDKKDDLGKGGDKESLKTGNAGKRIACGIIGLKNILI